MPGRLHCPASYCLLSVEPEDPEHVGRLDAHQFFVAKARDPDAAASNRYVLLSICGECDGRGLEGRTDIHGPLLFQRNGVIGRNGAIQMGREHQIRCRQDAAIQRIRRVKFSNFCGSGHVDCVDRPGLPRSVDLNND